MSMPAKAPAPTIAPSSAEIDAYLALVRKFPLVPIRDDAHLTDAMAMVDDLCARDVLTDAEEAYQDVLGTLIGIYEAVHVPMPDVPGHEMLRYLIEERGQTRAAVASAVGIATIRLNEMVEGKRRIGPAALRKLGDDSGISPAVFL